MLTATFLRSGYVGLKPMSEKSRYDLVIDRGAGFERVQCKTGRIKNGSVVFNTCSSMAYHGGGRRHYRGEIELFGVYCPATDICYLVPVDAVGLTEGNLRISEPKRNQTKHVRMAEPFQLPLKH